MKKDHTNTDLQEPLLPITEGEGRTQDRGKTGLHSGPLPALDPLLCCAEQGCFLFPVARLSPILPFPVFSSTQC